MRDDRTLLELAAKAAGIELRFLSDATPFSNGPERVGEWNPIEDDRDALRLAVKLDISTRRVGNLIEVHAPTNRGGYRFILEEFAGDDRCAATRRAIVRAAAEIGKAMQ